MLQVKKCKGAKLLVGYNFGGRFGLKNLWRSKFLDNFFPGQQIFNFKK